MSDNRNDLAKARDTWLDSKQGQTCAGGIAEGVYLKNRLETAFISGWEAKDKEIEQLKLQHLTDNDFIGSQELTIQSLKQALADKEAAIESWREEEKLWKEFEGELTQERDGLREVLKARGVHSFACQRRVCTYCFCGLDEALNKGDGDE